MFNAGNVPYNIEMFNKMSGPSNSSDVGDGDAASTSVDAGISQGVGLAEDLDKPDCPITVEDGHFIEKSDNSVEESLKDMDIKTKIRNLKDDEVLTLTQHDVPDFPYLKIKKNPKFDNMFIIWDENDAGEIVNRVNFSSFNNTVYWAEKCDEAFKDQPEEVNESMENNNFNGSDSVELEYTDLPIIVYEGGSPSGRFDTNFGNWLPDEGEERELEVDYTYTITKNDALEVIQDEILESPSEEIEKMTDEEFNKYLEDNFDELFDKYEE